ncbi:MAG: uncharacterized protein KVP18_004406 [Porospora cf. gigantea A]|uniref:uncharacterized protein n=1 Tax=Porospora cf. gigantea A TaxID=2853593 RepID=UPI00355A47BA|nr:MAG: hypothetical protein KVP18_004406 [Porospora cf. gigantea A]
MRFLSVIIATGWAWPQCDSMQLEMQVVQVSANRGPNQDTIKQLELPSLFKSGGSNVTFLEADAFLSTRNALTKDKGAAAAKTEDMTWGDIAFSRTSNPARRFFIVLMEEAFAMPGELASILATLNITEMAKSMESHDVTVLLLVDDQHGDGEQIRKSWSMLLKLCHRFITDVNTIKFTTPTELQQTILNHLDCVQ